MSKDSLRQKSKRIKTNEKNSSSSSKKKSSRKTSGGEYVPFVSHSGSYHHRIKTYSWCEATSVTAMVLFLLIRLSSKYYAISSVFIRNGKSYYALRALPATWLTVLATGILIGVLIRAKRRRHKMRLTILVNSLLFLLSLLLIWTPFPA